LPTAVAIKGKRLVKSLPWRVISRTSALSRRARIRKPSCLISCRQSGPDGGRSAGNGRQGLMWPRRWVRRDNVRVPRDEKTCLKGDGRHGSIIPSPGRVRSRNELTLPDISRDLVDAKDCRLFGLPHYLLHTIRPSAACAACAACGASASAVSCAAIAGRIL
jgi:hypothetical protein